MTVTNVRKDPEALTMVMTAELNATVERACPEMLASSARVRGRPSRSSCNVELRSPSRVTFAGMAGVNHK